MGRRHHLLLAAFLVAVLATQVVNAGRGRASFSDLLSRHAIKPGSTAKTASSDGYDEEAVLVFTEVEDADCIQSTPNAINNLDDFFIRTKFVCGAPEFGRTAYSKKNGVLDMVQAPGLGSAGNVAGECDWTFDLWTNFDEAVQVNTVPPAKQVATVMVSCQLDLSKCGDKAYDKSYDKEEDKSYDKDGDKSYGKDEDKSYDKYEDKSYDTYEDKSYDKDEDKSYDKDYNEKGKPYSYDKSQEVTLIGCGAVSWYDNMYVDRLPGFPSLDKECTILYGPARKRSAKGQGATGNDRAFIPKGYPTYRDWRIRPAPDVPPSSTAPTAPKTPAPVRAEQDMTLQQGDGVQAKLAYERDNLPRTYWRTSVLVASGTFSVTTQDTKDKFTGGTFVYVHGYDADTVQVTGEPATGYLFSPLTATFAFQKDSPSRY